jgi:hypothetical protein
MRSAEAVLEELVLHVRPPRGCAIVLTEWKSSGPTDPNWVAASGNMEMPKLVRYGEKIAELRKTDPQIDWSDVKILAGRRRVALWLSRHPQSNEAHYTRRCARADKAPAKRSSGEIDVAARRETTQRRGAR